MFNIDLHEKVASLFFFQGEAEVVLEGGFNRLDRIIYGFVVDEKIIYVGKSECIKNRIHAHAYLINNSNFIKRKKIKDLEKKISENTKEKYLKSLGKSIESIKEEKALHICVWKMLKKDAHVEIVILDRSSSTSFELSLKEKELIKKFNTLYPKGCNLNQGGGGGCARDSSAYQPFRPPFQECTDIEKLKKLITPTKERSFGIRKSADGKFFVSIPPHISMLENLVYRIKKDGTIVETLYGETEQSFGSRVAQYMTKVNNSQDSYYCDIRENYEKYSIGIVFEVPKAQDPKCGEEFTIGKIGEIYSKSERILMNKTKGVNGSSRLVRLLEPIDMDQYSPGPFKQDLTSFENETPAFKRKKFDVNDQKHTREI